MAIAERRSHKEYQLAKLMFEECLKRNLYLYVDAQCIEVRGAEPGVYVCTYFPGPGQRVDSQVVIGATEGSVRMEAMLSLVGECGFPSDTCAVSSEIEYFDFSEVDFQSESGLIDIIVVGIGEIVRWPFSAIWAFGGGIRDSVLVSDLGEELERISLPIDMTDEIFDAADDFLRGMVTGSVNIDCGFEGVGTGSTKLQRDFFACSDN